MDKDKIAFKSENLDELILQRLGTATPVQLESIPPCLYKRVIGWEKRSVLHKLSDSDKLMLLECLNMRIFVLIEDSESGIDKDTFVLWKRAARSKADVAELAAEQHEKKYFVLSGRDLSEGLRMSANASISTYYRIVRKLGTKPRGKRDDNLRTFNFAFRWFLKGVSKYEGSKRAILGQNKLHLVDFYCLLFFAKNEGSFSDFLGSDFAHAYSSSIAELRRPQKRLYDRGLLIRTGQRRTYRYVTSDTGMKILEKVFASFLIT